MSSRDDNNVLDDINVSSIKTANAAFRESTVECVNTLADFMRHLAEYLFVLKRSKNITVPQGQSHGSMSCGLWPTREKETNVI